MFTSEKGDFTLLGFFGATIPSVRKPRVIKLELIQSGETQKVQAFNINLGSVKSMGMVLFNVHTPEILIGAIEDKQDFEIKFNGETIARGAWHSGLNARDEMSSCLSITVAISCERVLLGLDGLAAIETKR